MNAGQHASTFWPLPERREGLALFGERGYGSSLPYVAGSRRRAAQTRGCGQIARQYDGATAFRGRADGCNGLKGTGSDTLDAPVRARSTGRHPARFVDRTPVAVSATRQLLLGQLLRAFP